MRALNALGYPVPITRSRAELDLTDQAAVRDFFRNERPGVVFLAAAKVGGILANDTYRWDFLFQNLVIETNILGAALESDVSRVVFFGSSCIYPKLAPQPLREEYLLSGPLEPTNEPYAIAKIAGLKLVETALSQYGMRWVSVMPTNLYGPGDNFDLQSSHVLPAMIRKFHEAKAGQDADEKQPVRLWGTGAARREFLFVDDLASASVSLMRNDATGMYNVGAGQDITIRELATLVAEVVGYHGPVVWDASCPDGTPQKLLDSSKMMAMGWRPKVALRDGIARTYRAFLQELTGRE